MNKNAIFVLFFMLLSFMVISNQTNESTTKQNAIPSIVKIGFLYPATGGLGPIGQGLMDGARAAAHRINATYSSFKVVIVSEDTATDPTQTATATNTLLTDNVSIIVGAAASGDTLAAAAITVPAKVPLISYASTSPAITDYNDTGYLFRDVASDAYQGVALANLSYNRGVHNAYVLNLNNPYGNGVYQKFAAAYKALGGTIAGEIAYDPTASTFSTEISTVKASSADGVVMVSYPADANLIFAEAQTQNLNLNFYGTDGIASTSVTNATATKTYLSGRLFGTTPSTGVNAAQTLYPQFLADLTATSGSYGVYGDYVYDAFLLAAAAVNKSNGATGAALRDALYSVANGFKGSTSPNKAFNCDGEPISQTYDYWNASNGAVATMQSAAIAFSGLGQVSTYWGSCLVSSTSTTSNGSVPSPGFEIFMVIGVLVVASIGYQNKRKNN